MIFTAQVSNGGVKMEQVDAWHPGTLEKVHKTEYIITIYLRSGQVLSWSYDDVTTRDEDYIRFCKVLKS